MEIKTQNKIYLYLRRKIMENTNLINKAEETVVEAAEEAVSEATKPTIGEFSLFGLVIAAGVGMTYLAITKLIIPGVKKIKDAYAKAREESEMALAEENICNGEKTE